MTFIMGQTIRNLTTLNVYRVDLDGLTLVTLGESSKALIETVRNVLGDEAADEMGGEGTTYPYSLVDPNDFPNDFEVVE